MPSSTLSLGENGNVVVNQSRHGHHAYESLNSNPGRNLRLVNMFISGGGKHCKS